jgi:hypothetical protein
MVRLAVSLCLVATTCIVNGSASAAIIVSYPSVSSLDHSNRSVAPDAVNSVAADNLTAGPGLMPSDFADTGIWRWTGWSFGSQDDTSFDLAVAGGDFWTWGFEVTAAETSIDLTSLSMRLSGGSMGYEIRVQVNGGAAVPLLFPDGDTHDSIDGDRFYVSPDDISLSFIPTLKTGDTILFTLAGFGSEEDFDSMGLFASIVEEPVYAVEPGPSAMLIQGVVRTAAVPEADALTIWSLLAIGFAMIVAYRRGAGVGPT